MTSPAQRPRRRWVCSVLALSLIATAACLSALPVAAQTPPAAAGAKPEAQNQPAAEDPLGRSTPFGAFAGFMRAAQRQDFARAAAYLDTPLQGARAEDLARQFYAVIDRGLAADLDRLSRSPKGNLQDDLPETRDRIGVIDTRFGKRDVLIDRIERPNQLPVWLFASDTLALVPVMAEQRGSFDPEAYIPRPLVENKLLSQPLYRWFLAPVVLGLVWLLGTWLARAMGPVLRPVLRRLTGERENRSHESLSAPMRLVVVAVAIRLCSSFSTTLQTRQFWTRVAVTVFVTGVAWLVIRLSKVAFELATRRLQRRQSYGRIAVLVLAGRLFRTLVVVAAALGLLYRAGVDLTAILTGLGIGGLGLALAAQKTLENLFGGISIITDEPIRVGDFCRIADQMGTVEDIGLRSTRIRTLARTVVAVPNGQLATMSVENFSLRDKLWLRHTIGVRHETSADQMRHLLASVRAMLYAHPKIQAEDARVRFVGFGGSSLELEVFGYVNTADFTEFLAVQEDVLLRIIELVAASGTSIALPSQTTYLAKEAPLDAERTLDAERQVRQWREHGELPFPDFPPDQLGHLRGSVQYPPRGSATLS
jgi:MscS family membrane protein